jgi:hypothetical protein
MRLIWAVIPLVLIVSVIGIVGMQEADALCVQNEDLPHTPCLDEPIGHWSEYISQEPFELQKGVKEASFGAIPIHFRIFDIEDSRCPSDVQCVWEGQVTVTMNVVVNWEDLGNYDISLNDSLDGSTIQLDQYSLELLKVEPYPASTESIPEWDYVATMQFSLKEIQSPKKQLELGIALTDIICKEELQLIFTPNNSPACVTSQTAEKLIQRGWNKSISNVALDQSIDISCTTKLDQENRTYSVRYDINNAEIINVEKTGPYLTFLISPTDDGFMSVELPRGLTDALKGHDLQDDIFFVLINGVEIEYAELKTTNDFRLLQFDFEHTTNKIDIIGTVPLPISDTLNTCN